MAVFEYLEKSKAQVQPVSAVIMVGIVVALVGAAYAWGVPLIEKRTTITEFETLENFADSVSNSIIDLVNSGAGEKTIDLRGYSLRLVPDGYTGEDNNSLVVNLVADQPLLFPDSTIYLGSVSHWDVENEIGRYGESSPEIISLTQSNLDTNYELKLKIHYRELDTNSETLRGYKIVLCKKEDRACEITDVGTGTIRLSFDRSNIIPGGADNGGDLVLTYIDIELV